MERRTFFKLAGASAAVTMVTTPTASASPPSRMPKLAKDCTPAELAARRRDLAEARQTYIWSLKVENVEGVPMAAHLPTGENPTVDWLIELNDLLFDLVENLLDSAIIAVLPQMKPAVLGFSAQLHTLKNRFIEATNTVNALTKKYSNATLDTVIEHADKLAIGTAADTFIEILSEIQNIRRNLFSATEEYLTSHKLWIGDLGSKDNLKKYNALWASMPLPEVAAHLHDDGFFGYTRVAGPNPMVIERVQGSLPSTLKIDSAAFAAVAGESLESAAGGGRLYVCDYRDLGKMAKSQATYKVLTGPNYNTAPIGLFVRPASSEYLKPIAIQVGQVPGTSPVFYAPTGATKSREYWGWQMAKTVLQTADFNHHEMFSHLAWTHLVSEAFCMATHRQLPTGHPLRVLLEPHFEGDLNINNLAASIIMGPNTFADIILASEISISQATTRSARLGWNFSDMIPARNFAKRGVDDPALAYPYRDDALLIWDDIESWVSDYIHAYYRSDGDVVSDRELSGWLSEVTKVGRVQGIGEARTRARLIEVITMVVFTASAQHSAVNYPQADQLSYAPFFTGTLHSLVSHPDRKHTEHEWFQMMPTLLSALAQMYFLNILGGIYYRRLGDYRTNVFPYPRAIVDPKVKPQLAAFQRRLGATEAEIKSRNRSRRWNYDYLLPSQISMSTHI